MKKQGSAASTVDEYINEFSKEVQTILENKRYNSESCTKCDRKNKLSNAYIFAKSASLNP